MPVPYRPLTIANEFIVRFGGEDGIEHMKLQKLVYCSFGWWLSSYGIDEPRLVDEGPEIWKHGPVFNSLYKVLRVFGRRGITQAQSDGPFAQPLRIDEEDKNCAAMIDWIWGRYGHLSSFALSDMTHKPGTPWHKVATESNFHVAYNTKIPDQYIYEEFTNLSLSLTSIGEADGRTEIGKQVAHT